MRERMLQVRHKLIGRAVHERVAEAGCPVVAGVLRADQPLAHRQRLNARCGHHIAGACIDEHLGAIQALALQT